MDSELLSLLGRSPAQQPEYLPDDIEFVSDDSAQIEFKSKSGDHIYILKPIDSLYGKGLGVDSVDMLDERFRPILMTIERAIIQQYHHVPSLTDATVILSLKSLTMNTGALVTFDPLAHRIQRSLRLFLSLNDHSRQEVKLALRKVLQSVERHTRLAGPRGYLTFIENFLPD